MTIRFGCQTYTWQMSFDQYAGQVPHILDVIAEAGFCGVEAEVCMLGSYYKEPKLLATELNSRNLQLAALTLALPWENAEETEEENQEADRLIRYLRYYPNTLLILAQLPAKDRSNLAVRQIHALNCFNAVARRAHEQGIAVAFHPNSPTGSIFRTAEDYKVLFAGLDPRYIGYAPDSGHIANGGMDVMQVMRENRSLIKHVHFKDISADCQWKIMGEGVIDHPAVVAMLKDTGYKGWIMVEEESADAETDPDRATRLNGKYVQKQLSVLITEI